MNFKEVLEKTGDEIHDAMDEDTAPKVAAENIYWNVIDPYLQDVAEKFLIWKIENRIRSAPAPEGYRHWFPGEWKKPYTTKEMFKKFLHEQSI